MKIGKELIVTTPVKVHSSSSSSSGYIILPVGTVLLVTKKNAKSYTVAYRDDSEIYLSSSENFILPSFRQDRLKIEDLSCVVDKPTKWQDIIKLKDLYQ